MAELHSLVAFVNDGNIRAKLSQVLFTLKYISKCAAWTKRDKNKGEEKSWSVLFFPVLWFRLELRQRLLLLNHPDYTEQPRPLWTNLRPCL